MQEKQRKKCQTLEEKCLEEETADRKRVVKALAQNCVTAIVNALKPYLQKFGVLRILIYAGFCHDYQNF